MIKSYSVDIGETHCDYCPFTGLLPSPDVCRKYIGILLDIDCKKHDLTTIKKV